MRYSNTAVSKNDAPIGAVKKKHKFSIPDFLIGLILTVFTVICLLSLLLVVIGAFSSETSIAEKGFSFFPTAYSAKAFNYVANFGGQLVQSYVVSIFVTASGTFMSLLLTSMLSYTLSRKHFKLNGFLSVYVLFTMLFSGGLLGSYLINTNVFNLRNNILVLIIPTSVTAWNVFVMRTFIVSNIPDALLEAAKIDGAGDVRAFFQIVLPLLKPALAALGFMIAVGLWNEWQTAFLYIDSPNLAPLQLMLIRIEKNLEYLQQRSSMLSAAELKMIKESPSESARMAVLLFTIAPVLFIYPFFQKYFIKGITLGSVKG